MSATASSRTLKNVSKTTLSKNDVETIDTSTTLQSLKKTKREKNQNDNVVMEINNLNTSNQNVMFFDNNIIKKSKHFLNTLKKTGLKVVSITNDKKMVLETTEEQNYAKHGRKYKVIYNYTVTFKNSTVNIRVNAMYYYVTKKNVTELHKISSCICRNKNFNSVVDVLDFISNYRNKNSHVNTMWSKKIYK